MATKMTPAQQNMWDLNKAALKQCSIEKDWYGEPHGPHADGHDCQDPDIFPDIHMDRWGGIDYVNCGRCGFLLQVG